jgi:hypothetical protein
MSFGCETPPPLEDGAWWETYHKDRDQRWGKQRPFPPWTELDQMGRQCDGRIAEARKAYLAVARPFYFRDAYNKEKEAIAIEVAWWETYHKDRDQRWGNQCPFSSWTDLDQMGKQCNLRIANARKVNLSNARPFTLGDAYVTEKGTIVIDYVQREKEQEKVFLDELFLHDVEDDHLITDPNDTEGLRWWEEFHTEIRRRYTYLCRESRDDFARWSSDTQVRKKCTKLLRMLRESRGIYGMTLTFEEAIDWDRKVVKKANDLADLAKRREKKAPEFASYKFEGTDFETISPWSIPEDVEEFIEEKLFGFNHNSSVPMSKDFVRKFGTILIRQDYDREEQKNIDVWAMSKETQSDESSADDSSEKTSSKWWKDYQADRQHRWVNFDTVPFWLDEQDVIRRCDIVIWKIFQIRKAHHQPFRLSLAAEWETKLVDLITLKRCPTVAALSAKAAKKKSSTSGKRKIDQADTTDFCFT